MSAKKPEKGRNEQLGRSINHLAEEGGLRIG